MKITVLLLITVFLANSIASAQTTEQEPNDTFSEASSFSINSSVNGQLGGGDQRDWYIITTPFDGEITFIANCGSDLAYSLFLKDNDGSYGITSSGTNYGQIDTLSHNYLKAGTYYFLIYGNGPPNVNYSIVCEFTPTSKGNDIEPNDSYEEAALLNPDSPTSGHLGFYGNKTSDEKDWYKIVLSDNDQIECIAMPDTTLNTVLYLYDIDGTYLLNHTGSGTSILKGVNDTLIYDNFSAGTYYVKIDRGTGSGTYGSYSINYTISKQVNVLKISTTNTVSIFPNPFNHQINIQSDNGINRFSISNIIGTQVKYQEVLNENSYTIYTADLAKGIYLLSVEDLKGNRKSMRIIKQ